MPAIACSSTRAMTQELTTHTAIYAGRKNIEIDRHLAAVGSHNAVNVNDVHCAAFTLRDFVQRCSNFKAGFVECHVRLSIVVCGRAPPRVGWRVLPLLLFTLSCQQTLFPGTSCGGVSQVQTHIPPS